MGGKNVSENEWTSFLNLLFTNLNIKLCKFSRTYADKIGYARTKILNKIVM